MSGQETLEQYIASGRVLILAPYKTYTLKDVYKKPYDNGYGKSFAYQRFNFLKSLCFNSVLDVGSGPCFLHDWLKQNKPETNYEAVDIRPETLELCKCQTYSEIPKNKTYDLVCLFGTVSYNFDYDNETNKEILISLLRDSISVSNRYVLFTVLKKEGNKENIIKANRYVYYSKEEISELLSFLDIQNTHIISDELYDSNEWFVLYQK